MGINGLWDILGEGEVWHIADYAADFFKKHKRPLRIAVDEPNWRFRNLNAFQVEKIREGEAVILQRIYRLLRLNIQLIFVDDGLRKPRNKRGKAGGGKTDDSLKSGTRKLLTQLKIPHHQAPGEAEAECARMQALGIVDAVWSDDGDSFMFGCGTLMKQHKVGQTNAKDYVRLYGAEDLLQKHDMDRESLVLFALLAEGDYVKEGLPGCGPKAAAKVATRQTGLARAICHADRNGLAGWRQDLQSALRKQVPADFPDFKALGNYRNPIKSTDEQLRNLRGLKNGWDRRIDEPILRVYLRHMMNFTTREYLKHIAPIFVARRLARVARENAAENVELGLQLKRTRKVKVKEGEDEPPAKSEVKVWFRPTSIVEIDLSSCPPKEDWSKFDAKDGTPYDPTQPVECELLGCFLEHGLPEGALLEAAPPPRKRKRKTDAEGAEEQGSPSSNSPRVSREEGHSSQASAAGKKRGRPRKDPSAAADKTTLPERLDELKAKAMVVDLRDDDGSETEQSCDSDEDPELALAIQSSLTEERGPSSSGRGSMLGLKSTYGSDLLPSSSHSKPNDRVYPRKVLAPMDMSRVPSTATPDRTAPTASQPADRWNSSPRQALVPGEAISAQALRELRAGSSLLREGASTSAVQPASLSRSAVVPPARKIPEVIDLT